MGHESCDYIDDTLLIGRTAQECADNVQARTALTQSLGFTINTNKSLLTPTQEIVFLGFKLNSANMTISIPSTKVESTLTAIRKLLEMKTPKIRDVASIIGLLVSYGPMYRRTIENEKNKSLAENNGDFESKMVLSNQAIEDLHWWSRTLPSSAAPMHRHTPDYIVETDASPKKAGVPIAMAALLGDNGPTKKLFIISIVLNSKLVSLLCNHSFLTMAEL